VADDHRPPRANVVDVAVAVGIEQVWAVRTLHEERLAADRLERAHRRIHAAGHQRLGAGEQVVRAFGVHGVPSSEVLSWKRERQARAAATGSGASNPPLITATRSAPASTSGRALSAVMPPIATRGRPRPALSRSSPGDARRAPGLVGEGKKAPK